MNSQVDILMFGVVCIALFIWLIFVVRRWLSKPRIWNMPWLDQAEDPDPDVVDILEQEDYTVIAGKLVIPIRIRADNQSMRSRLYVDGVAQGESGFYFIKLARDRRPVEWTGSGLRDAFLPYCVISRHIKGILYVQMGTKQVSKITLRWDEEE